MSANRHADRLLDIYRRAVATRDVDAFMSLYDPDVRVFDTWGTWSYEGAPAWRGMVEGWFGSLGNETVDVTFDDVRVASGDDFMLVTLVARYAAVEDGNEKHALQNRFTWACVLDGRDWKIIHEHTSVPVGFEDMKGILERPV
ncbi:hypothetical protein BH09PSE6_BH09PSE6_12610 [soil metagenome]